MVQAIAKTSELSSSGMEIEIAELVYGLMTSKKEKIQKKIKNKDDDKKKEKMEIEVDSDSAFEVNVRSKSEVSQVTFNNVPRVAELIYKESGLVHTRFVS
ncbi:hypothetical protein P8452_60278 [Trifolium repens]|nr:hypothetical protein P8452_60278 [Trifolium repens]